MPQKDRITLLNCILSYPALANPKKDFKGDGEHYSCDLLLDPASNSYKDLDQYIKGLKRDALQYGLKPQGALKPRPLTATEKAVLETLGVKHADLDILSNGKLKSDTNPEYAGYYTITAKSIKAPVILDARQNTIPHDQIEEVVYAGAIVNAVVKPVIGISGSNVYLTYYLQTIQKWADSERFGGGSDNASLLPKAKVEDDLPF